jgi:ADP-ribose pyrophosphatase YjhB (NUDIX family)
LSRVYPKLPIVGVGVILICEGRILLAKRKNEPGKDKWSVPGGLVELGETLEQTVVREAREETGLFVEDPEPIDVISQVTLDESGKIKYHFIIIDYFVRFKNAVAEAGSDVGELEWVTLDQVEKKDLTESFGVFFRKNEEKLKKLNSLL